MGVPVFGDDDILPLLDMGELRSVTEDFLTASQSGHTVSPPGHSIAFDRRGSLVFTIGGVDWPRSTFEFLLVGPQSRTRYASRRSRVSSRGGCVIGGGTSGGRGPGDGQGCIGGHPTTKD